jgi:hypothetical protein
MPTCNLFIKWGIAGSCNASQPDFQAKVGAHAGRHFATTKIAATKDAAETMHDTSSFPWPKAANFAHAENPLGCRRGKIDNLEPRRCMMGYSRVERSKDWRVVRRAERWVFWEKEERGERRVRRGRRRGWSKGRLSAVVWRAGALRRRAAM